MHPVFGGEVVEREQMVELVDEEIWADRAQ
jgi:hypothetical protein